MARRQNAEALRQPCGDDGQEHAAAKKSTDPDVQKAAASTLVSSVALAPVLTPAIVGSVIQPTAFILQPVAIASRPAPDW